MTGDRRRLHFRGRVFTLRGISFIVVWRSSFRGAVKLRSRDFVHRNLSSRLRRQRFEVLREISERERCCEYIFARSPPGVL